MLWEREHSQRPTQSGRSTAYEAATLHRSSMEIDCILWMTAPTCLPSTRLAAKSYGNTPSELCSEHRRCSPMENCTSELRTESFSFLNPGRPVVKCSTKRSSSRESATFKHTTRPAMI